MVHLTRILDTTDGDEKADAKTGVADAISTRFERLFHQSRAAEVAVRQRALARAGDADEYDDFHDRILRD